jgi:hypothetical protein
MLIDWLFFLVVDRERDNDTKHKKNNQNTRNLIYTRGLCPPRTNQIASCFDALSITCSKMIIKSLTKKSYKRKFSIWEEKKTTRTTRSRDTWFLLLSRRQVCSRQKKRCDDNTQLYQARNLWSKKTNNFQFQ